MLPFGVLTTSTLSKKVYAESLTDPWSWSNGIQQELGHIDLAVNTFLDGIPSPVDMLHTIIIEGMNLIYGLLSSVVLHTPLWLFTNEWFSPITQIFSVLSVLIISVMSLVQIIRYMLQGKELDDWGIVRRFVVALSVSSFSPTLLRHSVEAVNTFSKTILSIGQSFFNSFYRTSGLEMFAASSDLLLTLVTALLVCTFGIFCIPIILQSGRRFFEMITLGALTPLAMAAWVFPETKAFHSLWWSKLKQLFLTQVYYALYVIILGLILFSTPHPTTTEGYWTKLLVMIGGALSMLDVPSIVSSKVDRGRDVGSMVQRTTRQWKKATKPFYSSHAFIQVKKWFQNRGGKA